MPLMYSSIRPFLFSLDPEQAHRATLLLGELAGAFPPSRDLVRSWYAYEDKRLATEVCGLRFGNPVGLAAGFDKDARLLNFLPALGFGFLEIGTVTPLAQPGNPRPRLFRLPEDLAILNRMGFNNAGVEPFAGRLASRSSSIPIGANIGKNKATSNDDAIEDYKKCFRALADHADYLTVNVSSPNTPGLRALQEKEPLRALLQELQALNQARSAPVPLFLKIAPDLGKEQLDGILELVLENRLSGIVAANTTVNREGLKTPTEALGTGGISGRPVRARSTEVIRYLHEAARGKLAIIGVGGIFSAEHAYAKIRAGACLVQVYTGLIYEGPDMVRRIKQGLVRLLEKDGLGSIKEAVGMDTNVHPGR